MSNISKYQMAFGVLLVCFVSIGFNAVYGYARGYSEATSALGALIYIAMDCVKSGVPFQLQVVRSWWGRIPLVLILIFCSIWSFTATTDLYLSTRDTEDTTQTTKDRDTASLLAEIERYRRQRDQLGVTADPDPIANEITQLLATTLYYKRKLRTVDDYTQGCQKPTNKTRKTCAKVADLRVELSRARTYVRLSTKVDALREELKSVEHIETSPNKLTHTVSQWFSISNATWNLFLGLLLAVTLELVTCVGPYFAFHRNIWRGNTSTETPTIEGDPGRFLTMCTKRVKGARISASDFYLRYKNYCAIHGLAPLSQSAFGRWLTQAGHKKVKSNGIHVYVDITLHEVV
ncbi:MAG: hypothetical protein AAGJ55_05315 [Cyanobacteria bacterium J06555_12]